MSIIEHTEQVIQNHIRLDVKLSISYFKQLVICLERSKNVYSFKFYAINASLKNTLSICYLENVQKSWFVVDL